MANNLLVDWLNNKKKNVQTNVLKKAATNTNNVTTPNLPIRPTTVSQTGLNLQKAQQPVQTRLNTVNSQTTPVGIQSNNPAFNNGALVNQNNQPSRFIGFQQPKLNTDLAGNIVNQEGNVLNTAQKGKSWATEMSKPVLNIPTQSGKISDYNTKQEKTYRDNEQVIKDFHYDVQKFGGMMNKEQISQLYPEFKGKEDIALMLQADILPLVQNNEFADMKKLSELYPELLPKQESIDAGKYKKEQETQENTMKFLKQRADKLLATKNTLSNEGKKYLQDINQLAEFTQYIRDNYRLAGEPTDIDILNYAKDNFPEVKQILDELGSIKLSGMDKAAIGGKSKNPFQNILATVQEGLNDISTAYQENVSQPLTQMIESGELARRLGNTGIFNASTSDTLARASQIPVNMGGGILEGANKLNTAYTRVSQGQDRGLDQVAQDVIHGGAGAIDIAFNATPLALATAVFEAANLTDAGQQITENTLGLFQEGITNILDGTFTESLGGSKDTYLASWYNSLDEETKSELTNEITVAVLHKGGKALKNLKIEGGVAVDAITNAFERGKGAAMFQAWIEKGLAGEGKATKGAVSRIFKEGMSEFKDALKENFRLYDTVVKNRRGDITSNMNTLPDNRTFREKAESKFNQAKETVNEGVNTVKEGVNNVVEGVQNIKPGEIIKNTAETVGKGVKATSDLIDSGKNAVTKGKNAVTSTIKENVIDPFKKGVEGVKNTVNENIVEPYNQGRGKTNQLNTETGMQGIQQPQGQLASATVNKINGDNYIQKNTNSKPLNKVQLQLLQNNNRMNPKTADTFKERYGEDYGQFLADRGFTKSSEDNLKDLVTYKKDLLENKNELLNTVEGTFKDQAINDMIDHIVDYVVDTVDRKNEKRFKALQEKANNEGLTMSEINDMRQWYSYHVKTEFFKEQNAKGLQKATNIYDNLKDFLDKIGEENGLTSLREINKEIMKTQHIIGGVSYKMNAQGANNLFGLTDYVLGATITDPGTLAIFLAKQMAKQPTVKNAILNATVGRRENAKNRITKESKQGEKEKIQKINKEKRERAEQKKKEEAGRQLQSDLSKSDTKALPNKGGTDGGKNILTNGKTIITDAKGNSKVKGQISEIDKRVKKSDTSSSDKQPEPKKDNTLSTKERLKANGFEDIDTKGINLDNIDVKKMSEILNKSRDYRLGKDKNGEYRVGYGDGSPKEKVNGDEAQLLMNIRDKKAPEEIKTFTGDKALTGAKLGYNKPTRNVVAKKSAVTEYVNETPQNERGQMEEIEAEENLRNNETPQRDMVEETKSEPKTNGGMQRQTGDSRNAKFTNTILDVIESNGGLKDGYLKVEKSGLEPLYIEEIGGGKIAIGQTYIQEGDVMFDPEIVFGVDENGRLQAETIRNDSMGIYEQPIKSNDPFLETWEVNLREFIKSEGESEPKTTTEITGEKNTVTSKATETEKPKNLVTNKPVDNSSITGRFRNLTLQDYKEMQKYQGVENQLINGNEQGYITDKIKAELLNQEKPLIPNAEIDELELYPVNYDDLKELVDKKKEIQDAERKLMKKNDDNLSQQIEDLRYGYDNEMLPNLGIYEVEDVDKAVSIIEKAMQDAHFQFFKDKEGIKPLVDKYGEYWKVGDVNYQNKVEMDYLRDISNIDMNETPQIDDIDLKSVDKKENTNIIGKNNSLTTKNTTNGGKDLGTAESGLNQGVQGASGSRDLQRTDGLSGTERDNAGGISGDLYKEQGNNDLIVDGKSAGPAVGQGQRKLLTRGEARAINQSSKDILEKHNFSTNPKDYTAEEIETLRQYEGAGGLTNKGEDTKGVLDQFYTPQTAIDAVWHLVDKYKNGKDTYTVLEPTVGTGRFIRDRANEQYEGHEIDKTPGTIAQILHPEAKISVGDFEDQFMDFTGRRPQEYQGGKKDIVVGNPPYSQRITPQQKNGLEPKIKRSEEFFIKKGIDVLDDGGILAMVVPSTFLSNPMTYAKEQIFDNATLVDAYRLPEGVFPYTQVGTDIVVFKKSKSLFKRENNLSDNKRFEQHPEKVLGEVKERINRFGRLEKYVDGGGHPLDKLNAIYEDTKTVPETKKEQAENYSPVETREETSIKQKTTTEITGEKNKVTAKTVTKKKPTKKGVKIENQTLIKGDKTDIGDSVFGKGELDNKLLEYSKKTDINGYVEGPVGELVENDPKNLNYYKMHAVTNDLYFAGDIYEKLEQLERDKTHISEAQYKKQKEGLQAVMPEPYTIENHPFLSPLDQNIMEFETNEIGNVYDSTAHDYVDKKLPIKDVFLERFRRNVSSSTVNKNLAREYINGEAMRSTSGGYGLSDEEKAARARHEKSVVMEQVNEIFNDWLWNKLDKDIQQKLLDKFNRENRSYVVPKYENMALATRGISKTFNGKPFKPQPGQVEGINFLLSKGAGIVAHGVGHGKTIEGVVATREAQLRGWNKRPLIVAPGPTLYAQWVRTIKELYPDWEIVNLGGLTKADIKRLKDELGDDPRNWVKDGQVAILSMQGFGDHIEFRPNTQRELEAKLHDVMETKDLNVRQSESLDKKISQMLAPGKGASSDKYTYSEKGDFLRTMYTSLLESGKEDFITDFVERTKEEYPDLKEDVIRADAEAMWNEKPVLLEDLGIDHITVDEMHNFKNVFTSAKMQEDEYGKKEVNRYGQIIKGNSSARGQKMYLATQYILDRNNNRNVFGLTATPFNNQPIEMYNMLSFVGRNELEKMGLTNINDFFSRFAEFREGLAPKASGTELEYKFIMKDFANARDLQRTITQFINYKGDSADLIKPEKKLKVPVLKMSELQKKVQADMEYMALAKENQGDVLKATNGMISNLVSPFIVAGTRAPTGWEDFLDNSPKLKYFADVLKELRADGKQDGMFIYMPVGQEFHELYAEALSKYAGVPREKIGIIDSKTSSKKDEIAEKFRSGEVNVLIGGKNTAEGIDLQNNGYITAITSVGWNPTERVQVDGRVWRQGNYNNEVLSVVPLIENSADVIFMGKADQKGSRINNALEQMLFGGEGDLSADEMMMSLMTEPEKKARTQINIQSQEIDKEIYGLNSQKDRLQELKRRINDAQKDPEEIQKQIDNEKQAGRSWRIPSLKDDLKTATRAKEWIEAYKENNGELPTIEDIDSQTLELEKQVDELRARQSELKNNDDVLNNLIEEIKKQQAENSKDVKSYQDYIDDIKSDFKNAKRFGSKEELKEYLNNKKKNVLSNDKNKITSK